MTGIEILKNNGLDKELSWFIKHNTSNNLPYHNFYHTLCVVKNCYNIVVNAYDLTELVNTDRLEVLLVSALFHDFNHSGGKLSDEENINRAINGFIYYNQISENPKPIQFIYRVREIIKATQYPYVIPEEELTLEQKIIRDADLMQSLEDNYLQQIVIGLVQEMNSDLLTGLEKSIEFWRNVKLHTKYAKAEYERKIGEHILESEYLLKILKEN